MLLSSESCISDNDNDSTFDYNHLFKNSSYIYDETDYYLLDQNDYDYNVDATLGQ